MKNYRQAMGNWGEKMAEAYLQAKGYQVLGRNIRTPYGEIDLLVTQAGVLVFVEVKTRSSLSYGPPEDGVTGGKQSHLLNSAKFYLQDHLALEQDWRVDVIAILGKPGDEPVEITHFENAIN